MLVSIEDPHMTLKGGNIKVIDDGLWYESEANTPFSPARVLQMTYHTARSYRIYTDTCKDWRRKPISDKMWANFKIFFVLEYNKLKEENILDATQEGFQHANNT